MYEPQINQANAYDTNLDDGNGISRLVWNENLAKICLFQTIIVLVVAIIIFDFCSI